MSKPVVLVVDDEDRKFCQAVQAIFEPEYIVIVAERLEDGYSLFLKHRHQIRLALIDLLLDDDQPGTNLVRKIRNRCPDLPVVLATEDQTSSRLLDAKEAGATAFFPKPLMREASQPIALLLTYWASGEWGVRTYQSRLADHLRAFAHRTRDEIAEVYRRIETTRFNAKFLNSEAAQILQKIDDAAEDLISRGRKLQTMSFHHDEFDLEPMVDGIVNDFASKGCEIDFEGVSAIVTGDVEHLREAILEIFNNAIKYSLEIGGSRLVVRMSKNEIRGTRFVFVSIRDFGLGVENLDAGLIFNDYVRGSNVSTIPGSGMGLSLVERALRDVRVGDEVGFCDLKQPSDGDPGTEAILYIPIEH